MDNHFNNSKAVWSLESQEWWQRYSAMVYAMIEAEERAAREAEYGCDDDWQPGDDGASDDAYYDGYENCDADGFCDGSDGDDGIVYPSFMGRGSGSYVRGSYLRGSGRRGSGRRGSRRGSGRGSRRGSGSFRRSGSGRGSGRRGIVNGIAGMGYGLRLI